MTQEKIILFRHEHSNTIPALFNSLKILVVDDMSTNVYVLKSMIQKYHIEVESAFNGQDAVEKVMNNKFTNYKLIFMDINMPVMNGIDATKKIREMEYSLLIPHIPIIAVSAQEEERVKKQAFEAGVDDYIEKPVHISKIEAILKQYCE